MAKGDNNDCDNNNSRTEKTDDPNSSFVRKVKSRVSGFIPTSFSKWFSSVERTGASVRPRDDEEDEGDPFRIQPPPSKRARIPLNIEYPPNSFIVDPPLQPPPAVPTSSLANCSSVSSTMSTKLQHIPTSSGTKATTSSSLNEPIPGPSGIKSQKLFSSMTVDVPVASTSYSFTNSTQVGADHSLMNGDNKSDSGESTSGYSSMPKLFRKEHQIGTQSSAAAENPASSMFTTPLSFRNRSLFHSSLDTQNRSLFGERSVSPQVVNSSLSSRRPSFNASTFGTPGFVDRTLTTKRILSSPFYSGRTMYGGAAASSTTYGKRQKMLSSPKDTAAHNSFHIKPVNETTTSENVVLSRTARRILDTLEQFSSPLLDVKKIPNPVMRNKDTGSNKPYSRATPVAANTELQVPTVPELLKMKRMEKLQDSTVAMRQIATSSKSALNAEEYSIRTLEDEISSKPSTSSSSNKMKSKLTLGQNRKRSAKNDEEVAATVNLPNISLPISTLPKFDSFMVAPPSKEMQKSETVTKAATPAKTPEKTQQQRSLSAPTSKAIAATAVAPASSVVTASAVSSTTATSSVFKFAPPIIVTNAAAPSFSRNSYKFSDPIIVPVLSSSAPKEQQQPTVNFKSPDTTPALPKLKTAPQTKNNGQVSKPAKELHTSGSVMDVLGKKDNIMEKFKPATGTWECTSCMVRNLPHADVCVACTTPKSQTSMAKPSSTSSSIPSIVVNSSTFGDKFKAPSETWECPTCMIRNKNDLIKCAACETPKPSSGGFNTAGLAAPIKTSSSGWECSACMVMNEDSKTKCVCCETPKPGVTASKSSLPVNFKSSDWECSSCMVMNSSDKLKCVCCDAPKPGSVGMKECKFGIPTSSPPKFSFGIKPAENTSFSFGIPASASTNAPKPSDVFGSKSVPCVTQASFSFGVKPSVTVTTSTTAPMTTQATGFTFGVSSSDSSKPATATKPDKKDVTDSAKAETPNPLLKPIPRIEVTQPTPPVVEPKKLETPASSNLFAFGGSKTVTAATSSTTSAVPTFSFGSSSTQKSTASTSTTTSTSPIFAFGSAATSKPVENAENKPTAVSTTTNSLTNATPTFGTSFAAKPTTSSQEPPSKMFMFGSGSSGTSSTSSTPTAGFAFKPTALTEPAKINFGAGQASSSTSEQQNNSAPTFGSSGGFNFKPTTTFGNPNQNASSAFSSFSSPTNGGFSVNSNKNSSSSSAATSSTGLTAAPVFNFGSGTTSATPAPNAVAATSNSTTVFNFGSANQNSQPATGGFSFGGTPNTSNMFANVGNIKPNFTLGANPTQFSAQGQPSDPLQQRKFKRAVRRTHR